ncbi:DUF2851 family protein [Flammeovirga aprica]|uniref:DUF2851 family protein n=1 Tax=Flammeovirga aprica JL-4 TaxID=694437 RepID=A0A7X9RST4_9BACT|nr:DUF2851 family protein [Flammeovirga aprica]NME67635.1 DUF2851 family protein [Flammeovirga aprica JL-4]
MKTIQASNSLMKEDFLYFIWKFRYFKSIALQTDQKETLEIISSGLQNHDAGPDFLNAHIRINGMDWHGNVEIHVKASDWKRHQHSQNRAYDNVILHVVWENDFDVFRNDKSLIPTLSIERFINQEVFDRYQTFLSDEQLIVCGSQLENVSRLHKIAMLDRVFMERIERKAGKILQQLQNSNRDWEECTYRTLAEYFGFKVNNDAFQRLSAIVPVRLLKLHAYQPTQVEAFLFGTAGFLSEKSESPYMTKLYKEYRFLSHKYSIKEKEMTLQQWKFLRLRPANFPTIRIAQLASIIINIPHLCSAFLHISSLESFIRFMQHPTSEYWHSHYHFNKKSKKPISPFIGKSALQSLLVNVVIPLQFAYGSDRNENRYKEKAIQLLESIPAENNKYTKVWKEYPIKNNSSLDSQGLIELYTQYCQKNKCLECSIGVQILSSKNKH